MKRKPKRRKRPAAEWTLVRHGKTALFTQNDGGNYVAALQAFHRNDPGRPGQVVIELRGSRLALGHGVAGKIMVETGGGAVSD